MAAGFNRVILIGNFTRDVELRYTPSGTAVADVGVAINEKHKDASGQLVEETTFVEVTLWGRTAEVAAEYLKKGAPVLIEGRLKLDTWDAEDGTKRSKMKVVCTQMQMLGSAPSKSKVPDEVAAEPTTASSAPKIGPDGEEIPF